MDRLGFILDWITGAPEVAMAWSALRALAPPLGVFIVALIAARLIPGLIARRAPAPLARFAPRMRAKLDEILAESKLWDGKAKVLQVTDVTDRAIEVRALASARNSPQAWDLRCEIREKMIAWLQAEHPDMLPRVRAELTPDRRARQNPAGPASAEPHARGGGPDDDG